MHSLARRNHHLLFFSFLILMGGIVSSYADLSVTIGKNFTGSTFTVNSQAAPPDANGAIGPLHFVEFINGTFAVYSRTNNQDGHTVTRKTDIKFWSDAGLIISPDSGVSDPRVIYDPASQRWFASQVDFNANATDPTFDANDFLLAVSDTADPRGHWHGFMFQSDPDSGTFADFPTLGLDANAVYLAADMYSGIDNPVGSSLVSIPKADLLAATPTIANLTFHGVLDLADHGEVLQPAICFDGSSSGNILAVGDIGTDTDPHSNIVNFVVLNAASATASLSAPANLFVTPYMVPFNDDLGVPQFNAHQPDGTFTLQANDARFSAKVYAVGGVLYAVHNTDLNDHLAIRWYRINATTHAVIESGTIADSTMDLFFPSIAVNPNGVVVIGCNGSSLNTFISAFAYVGQTVNGTTTFGSQLLLKSGVVSYHDPNEIIAQLLDEPVVDSRWGDYSAISVDPTDATHFWTIQMYPPGNDSSDTFGLWSTQITELIVTRQLPQLTIALAGTNVFLSWPSSASNFVLQSNTNLLSTNGWAFVAQTSITNGNQISMLVPKSAGQEFFRLRSP